MFIRFIIFLGRVIIIKSMKTQSSKSNSNDSSPQVSQYFNMISNYNLMQPLQSVEKTIFIYYVYQSKNQNSKNGKKQKALLNNLYTFANYLLNTSLKIKVKRDSDKPTTYKLSSEDDLIKHSRFNVQEASEYDLHCFTAGNQRVVILPVNKQLIDLIDNEKRADIERQKQMKYEKFYQNKEKTSKNQKQFKLELLKEDEAKKQKIKKIFDVFLKIEDLRESFLEKTKKVSIVGILSYDQNIAKETKKVFTVLKKIVSDGHLKPRLLVFHNRFACEEEDDNSDKEQAKSKSEQFKKLLNSQNCCGIFSYDSQNKFTSKLLTVWEQKYLTQKNKAKFVLFSQLRNSESQSFQICVQQFNNNLKKTAKSVVQPIAQIFQIVSRSFQDNYDAHQQTKFKSIHQQYKIAEVKPPKASDLENYYTKKTVFYTADKKEIGKNTSDTAEKKNAGENTSKTADKKETVKKTDFQPLKIPAVLNNMVFIHCFHNLNQSILKKDVQSKFDIEKRLQNWKEGLKNTFSLIANLFDNIKRKRQSTLSISSTSLLNQSQIKINSDEYRNSLIGISIYEDMQNYYNFLSFVFNQIQKIHRILGEATPFVDQFKTFYKRLTLKENKIINFIVENKKLIRTNEEILYYDILIYMIQTYRGNTKNDDLQYIECHVLQLKASEIACNYIYDESRIVQAVQAYATVARRIHQLPQVKNSNLFNLYQIEQKIAKLLIILCLPQKAAEIYMYLKMFRKAHKLSKQQCWNLKNGKRAQELLNWGKLFQNQFQYDLALELYSEAFQTAITNTLKVEALSSKRKCIARQRKPETEQELRAIQKYLSQKDLFQFTNQPKLLELFLNLQNLKWDEDLEQAIL